MLSRELLSEKFIFCKIIEINTIPMRLLIPIFLILLSSLVSAQTVLEGKLSWNEKWQSKIYISPLTDFESNDKRIDSIKIHRDGTFSYQIRHDGSNNLIYRLQLPPVDGNHNTIIEGEAENVVHLYLPPNGTIFLSADADSFCFSAKVNDSGINCKLLQLRDLKKPFRDLYVRIMKKINNNPDSSEQFKQEIYSEWMEEIGKYRNRTKKYIIKEEHPAVLVLGLYYYYMSNFGRYDSLFFSQTINRIDNQELPLIKKIRRDLKSVSANRLGMIFPGILLDDTAGIKKSIRDFNGKYYVIDFWASWCTPCRSSIRGKLREVYSQLKEKKVILIGISVDEDGVQWRQALQKDKPTWPQLRDAGQSATCQEYFEIFSYPTLFVLNENYKIIFETSSDIELEAYLKRITNN